MGWNISTRLYFFSKEKIDNVVGFANHIDTNSNNTRKDAVRSLYGGRDVEDWEKESQYAYQSDNEILSEEELSYNAQRMCIMRKVLVSDVKAPNLFDEDSLALNGEKKDESGEESVLKTEQMKYLYNEKNERIENPMQSLEFVQLLLYKTIGFKKEDKSILDYVPFRILVKSKEANLSLWKEINNQEDLDKYFDFIKFIIVGRKIEYFDFATDFKKMQFQEDMKRESFKEVSVDFSEQMQELLD